MTKTLKKILIISDDFAGSSLFGCHRFDTLKKLCEPGDIYYDKKSNWLKFEFTMVTSFHEKIKVDGYDAVLVDYGLIDIRGNSKPAIELLRKICDKRIPIAWLGGLAMRYNESAREDFPEETFLHNLKSSHIGHEDVLFLLYSIFEPIEKKQK